jgi:dephospho-CoA kinase
MEEYPSCVRELAEAFGEDILDEQGRLLRRKLADRAFATPEGQQTLTGITHPYIIRSLLEKIQAEALCGALLVFVDGAVIVGEPFEAYCDKIVVVDAPEEQQVARLCIRDGITEEQARRRIGAQLPRERLNAAADAVIRNDGALEHMLQQAQTVLQTLQHELQKNL